MKGRRVSVGTLSTQAIILLNEVRAKKEAAFAVASTKPSSRLRYLPLCDSGFVAAFSRFLHGLDGLFLRQQRR